MMMKGPHDKMHWGCCWAPVLGKLLWTLGLLDLIAATIAYWQGGEFYNISAQTWLWFALVKGVLAVGAKISKFHYCAHKMIGCGCNCAKCAGGNCDIHLGHPAR